MTALIYQPTASAMQGGPNTKEYWVLEHQRNTRIAIDPLMGWSGSEQPDQQLNLRFSNEDDAIEYAKRNDIEYTLVKPNQRKIKPKSYASNF